MRIACGTWAVVKKGSTVESEIRCAINLLTTRSARTSSGSGNQAKQAAGVAVLDQPFFAQGNIATAGGCLASQYLAGWVIARLEGIEAARGAMHYVAPVGEKDEYIERMLRIITPYLSEQI